MQLSTVLLDLDNTLLGNAMSDFLPAYFDALSRHLAPHFDVRNLRDIMTQSVQAIQTNKSPAANNLTTFMSDFTRRLNVEPGVINPFIETFYEQEFPKLQAVTTYKPEARTVVETLQAADITLVVATNPLFPETAIRQRLTWAGLDEVPFALVTTMENSFAIKPDLRYYREILDRTNSSPATTLMVGDDLNLDIAPAHKLGMQTWWVIDHLTEPPSNCPAQCDNFGSLAQMLAWVKHTITNNSP